MKQIFTRSMLLLIVYFILSWFAPPVIAQLFYQPQQYGQLNPPQGLLGKLYNFQTFLIKNVPTTYHGNQDVYATAYLPFVTSEHDINYQMELFGPHYTTGVALCSPKDPALGLYAPVQIAAKEPGSVSYYAFASIIPYSDQNMNYKGPFNTLPELNQKDDNFLNPVNDEFGVTGLKTAQEFTKFSHDYLTDVNGVGWNGFDKSGSLPILMKVDPAIGISHYISAEKTIYIMKDAITNDMLLTRTVIGHEISHGIICQTPGYNANTISASRDELNEGFANIIGVSFKNWLSPGSFATPNWDYYEEIFSKSGYVNTPLDNPKSISSPNTFKGQYYQNDPLSDDYDEHTNGTVMGFWFYLINEGKEGYVDDDLYKGYYNVKPLIENDKQETYKLALRILFNAFTEKLSLNADYPELRKATLEAATELGYAPGTNVYTQIGKAWDAVGVKKPIYNELCVIKTAKSAFNGDVSFYAKEGTLLPDPNSQKVSRLIDCSSNNKISTSDGALVNIFEDWDDDQIYGEANDVVQSKYAVSIHAFTQLAQDWYKNKLGRDGMDGSGEFTILNQVGKAKAQIPVIGFIKGDHNVAGIAYPLKAKFACRDQISQIYFLGVNEFLKDETPEPLINEWETIITSISHIFSLEIKKDYELKQQNPNAEAIWTLNEELSDNALVIDFANPKLYEKAALYQGINWSNVNADKNTGVLDLWYYLLTHGTPEGAGGYTSDELGDKVYVVYPLNKELALKIVWEAYKSLPVNSSFEEFRLATHAALQKVLGADYDPKGKEFIALTDAWAAVLGLPDYASTLNHYPAVGETIYPWPAKVGVQVEYPKYESARLFEVSKSANFKANEEPVYQFVSNAAPDMNTGMTFGQVNLEPGQTYFVRSRLSNSGDPRLGCAATPDPKFCESLKGKQKWTVTYEFKTEDIPAISSATPAPATTAPAWKTPVSWGNVTGSASYELTVTDNSGEVTEQTLSFGNTDEAPVYTIDQELALGQGKSYTYQLSAKQKLGSEWACHVLPNGMTLSFTQDEKDAFEDFYIPWTEPVTFKTDEPTLVLGESPADKEHVAILGPDVVLTATDEEKRGDHYRFFISEQPTQFMLEKPELAVKIATMDALDDQKAFQWTADIFKDPVLPFIPQQEKGKAPAMHTFIADMSLSPKPEIKGTGCIVAGKPVSFEWGEMSGVTEFDIHIFNGHNGQEIASGSTSANNMQLDGVSQFPDPGMFNWTLKAGVKNQGGKMMFGPEASSSYEAGPPPCTKLTPNGTDESYGGSDQNQGGLTLSWQADFAPDGYWLSVLNLKTSQLEVDQQVNTNSVLIKGLNFNTDYAWQVKPVGADGECNWAKAVFRTYGTGQNYKSDVEVTDQGDIGGSKDGTGNPGGNGNEDPPGKEGPCPGSFLVSMVNFEHVQIAILCNKLGDGEVIEGVTDIDTDEFIALLSNGLTVFPSGPTDEPFFKANDQIVLRIKIKALDGDWADIPFNEIPVVIFTTSGGQVMSHTFNFDDWQMDKEILMGTYHCANE